MNIHRTIKGIGSMLAAVLLIACGQGTLFATVMINFDDGTNDSVIGGFYSGLGVTFSNGEWDNFISPNEGLVGAGGLKLVGIGPDFQPKIGNPIVATFSSPLSSLSIRGLNVGANGARVDAYNSVIGGILLDFDEAFGISTGVDNHPLLLASSVGILRIELYQPASVETEGLLFDNLSFDFASTGVIPEPTSLTIWSLGAISLVCFRRQRRLRSA